MKRDGHDTIGMIKRFLNPISMMNIDVQVKNPGVDFEKFQNTEHNIVYITESACLGFFTMMKSSRPVNDDVCILCEDEVSSVDAASCGQPAEIVKT